jgi:hypothetical protein
MLECKGESTVAAHGVTRDTLDTTQLPIRLYQSGQFLVNVGFHSKVLGPWLLRGVNVKTSALPQAVRVIVRDSIASW